MGQLRLLVGQGTELGRMHLGSINRASFQKEQHTATKEFGNLTQLVEGNTVFTLHHPLDTSLSNTEFVRKQFRRNAVIGTTPGDPLRVYRLNPFHNGGIIAAILISASNS